MRLMLSSSRHNSYQRDMKVLWFVIRMVSMDSVREVLIFRRLKSFLDGEYEIIGFEESSGNDAGTVIWQCRTAPSTDYPYGNDFMGKT